MSDPFYHSPEWRALLDEIIRERGRVCEDPHCKAKHWPGQKIYGDHIIEIADGGAKLDKRNVMLRCASAHTIKSNQRRAERMRASPGKLTPEG